MMPISQWRKPFDPENGRSETCPTTAVMTCRLLAQASGLRADELVRDVKKSPAHDSQSATS